MRRYALAAVAMLFGIALAGEAHAQAGAYCAVGSENPVEVTGTSYAPTVADGCRMLVFTNANPVTVSLPAPTTLPAGWKIWVKAQGAGTVSVTPTTGQLDGGTAAVAVTQGTGIGVRSSNAKYYSTGLGIKSP